MIEKNDLKRFGCNSASRSLSALSCSEFQTSPLNAAQSQANIRVIKPYMLDSQEEEEELLVRRWSVWTAGPADRRTEGNGGCFNWVSCNL